MLVAAPPATVDILVNNLGIYESKAFADITDDDWHPLFRRQRRSAAPGSRAPSSPAMLERNRGRDHLRLERIRARRCRRT